ncbi:MAG: AraC family transcriptional regulator [Clostridia bacterium]|nr:AraC family transcriptional regulator [Clostridia bacterium]
MQHDILVPDENCYGIHPIIFGWDECAKNEMGVHSRNFWLLHYVVSGHGGFKIHGNEYSIGPGDLFVIPPDVPMQYYDDKNDSWGYMWIGFSCNGVLPLKLDDVIYCPEARKVFDDMRKCEHMTSELGTYLTARIWDLFAVLMRRGIHDKGFVERAVDIIHSEYMNEISVDDISNRIGLERSYFSVMFKKQMGISPKQYIVDYRMRLAASLMANHGQNVGNAAYSVGYTDVFTFSKMFKKRFGVSPSEYIRQSKISVTKL